MQMATILISSLFGTKDYAAFGYQIIKHTNLGAAFSWDKCDPNL